MGWMPSPSGDMRTKLPPLPLEYLLDKEVLKEFVFRVNSLGLFIVNISYFFKSVNAAVLLLSPPVMTT